ncbi:universal stress protein [[Eubacterium] cellulosolvens]
MDYVSKEFSADLIVMGWRSRGKVPGVGIGDLVLALLHKTDRPLLVHRRRYPDSIWY